MNREIGSEFWMDKISIETEIKTPQWLLKYGNITFTVSGRGAISLLLDNIETITKTVLMPAYICDSIIFPFIKNDYKCYFYDINEDLSPNIKSVLEFKDIGIFIHMGYFGFHTNSSLELVIEYFKENSTVIVEDVTHTLFSNYEKHVQNDFYIGSIRKWFGIPSGGFLASPKFKINKLQHENELFVDIRKEALLLKRRYIKNCNQKVKEKYLKKFCIAENILEDDESSYSIDNLSLQLISVLNDKELIEKRRNNYLYILGKLMGMNFIKVLFPVLDDDICPLFFPILIKGNRNQFKEKLIGEKIYCPIHWPVPIQIKVEKYKNSFGLYRSELSIPCDQRYGISDMERIVSVIKSIN